jgi:energy-coupling factor transport system substrate-specific component
MNNIITRWRTVDLIVGAVIAVAAGVIFVAWNSVYAVVSVSLQALTPGFVAILDGVWLMGGLLVASVVRKPGAALFGELLASVVSAVIGNQWGFTVLITGALQGFALEGGMWLTRRSANSWVRASIAGALGGVVQGVIEVVYWYPGLTVDFYCIYIASATVSGALFGAALSEFLVRSLGRTGILAPFGR